MTASLRRSLMAAGLTVAAVVVSVTVGAPGSAPLAAGLLGSPSRAPDTTDGTEADWAEQQLQSMTLDEKIAQLFVVRIDGEFQNANAPSYRETATLVEEFGAGGLIFGPGAPMTQIAMANDLQAKAERPLLVAQDTEWGVGMRIDEATSFPPAMAIGATRDASHAYRVGYATAREARALGVHQLYAPVADVNNNPKNPIINVRSFGASSSLVGTMASAFTRGAQRGGTLATVKHFPGHGDTDVDSHINLPILRFDRGRLDSLELAPFRQTFDAGVQSVMTGHLALPEIAADSVPATLSRPLTHGLLRAELGFDGLVVTDALNMQAVTRTFGVGETAVRVLEAGADLVLMSTNPHAAHQAVRRAVTHGRIDTTEINDSVRRLLAKKQDLGLHETRAVSLDTTRHRVAQRSHEVLSRTVARESLTLLANADSLLPLTPPEQYDALAVTLSDSEYPGTGDTFVDRLREQPAIESLDTRRLDPRSDSTDVKDHLADASDHDIVIVPSFLRVQAWSGSIGLSDRHHDFLEDLAGTDTPVAFVAFGNPYAPTDLAPTPDAILTAYGSGDASQRAAAQALGGGTGTPGRLPVTIPGVAERGDGLGLAPVSPREGFPESVGMEGPRLARLDTLLRSAMLDEAFPGGAVAVGRGPALAKLDAFGYRTYEETTPVQTGTQYDLASLTKVVATTTAVMKLYEADSLALDAPVARYLPAFAQNGKEAVTVRQLLAHSSGLKSYLGPSERGPTRAALLDTLMAQPLTYTPGTQSTYSGLNAITLMRIVETVSDRSFDAFCRTHIFEPLGMDQTGFYDASAIRDWVAPTTDTAGTRRHGSVHDPMARDMGGVSGNAGLFSTAEDLARFGYMLTHEGRIDGRQFLEPETIRTFTAQTDVPGSTRALGWDTKSPEGYSSAGDEFSASSFGHTGYTGTSFWVDPAEDLFFVLLTNRVYPDDTADQITQVRPRAANVVHRALKGPPRPLLPGPAPRQ
ncbi:glycoside hydrolase family 3 N-terminal domain-containing protein [Salinibacter altiplanensis]|uniref:glycoside hydrolase family 3 N-terminal domain-containing protein n=1 Tax=Salinibacter altiplanensis TaxID=1803181 RepID=UPI000C9EF33F|nr:glycoside hydrolase family 3 N-terminal domain-containing protein [Salinibacter altiplanensis]